MVVMIILVMINDHGGLLRVLSLLYVTIMVMTMVLSMNMMMIMMVILMTVISSYLRV